jgi:hypothetical protein
MAMRSRRRRPGGPFRGRVTRRDGIDAALLVAMVALLALGAALLARAPLAAAPFLLDDPPRGGLLNFYGVERNGFGAFHWAKPEATIAVPVSAPGRYRVTLVVQDSPAAPPGRELTIVAGDTTATVALTTTPQTYEVVARLTPLTWARSATPALPIALHAGAFRPAGDPRTLGPIVAGVAVTPVAALAPDWRGPALLLLAALALAVALRRAGPGRLAILALGAGAALALAVGALAARTAALRLLYWPALSPGTFGGGVAGLVVGILLVGAIVRATPRAVAGPPVAPTRGRDDRRFWYAALLAPVALAAALRFARLGALSLWLDEGATVFYSLLSWWRVLGLDGYYDLHPPLYYAAAKATNLVVDAALAGRVVSASAASATNRVAALVALALGPRAALVAGLALALSPLHLWYSQEGRMYALATLFVALAALALVGFARDGASPRRRWWWAALFAAAALAAGYSVYSAFYTLLPLGGPLLWIGWRWRRRALPLLVATAVAILGYLPWVPQLLATTRAIATAPGTLSWRDALLAATPESVCGSVLSVVGLGGTLGMTANSRPLPWDTWGPLHLPLLLLCTGAVLAGGTILSRRAPLLGALALCFLPGTIVVAILVSRVSPGYADRTVLAATVGWAIALGALVGAARPRWLFSLGLVALVALAALSLDTLAIVRASATKQQYRELLGDAALVAPVGFPVAPLGSWLPSFAEVYAPALRATALVDDRGQVVVPQRDGAPVGALWLAYVDNGWDGIDAVRRQLAARGYVRALHK